MKRRTGLEARRDPLRRCRLRERMTQVVVVGSSSSAAGTG